MNTIIVCATIAFVALAICVTAYAGCRSSEAHDLAKLQIKADLLQQFSTQAPLPASESIRLQSMFTDLSKL